MEAKLTATSAIKINPKCEKALFRRGQALLALGEAELASKDFIEVLKLEPTNKASQMQLTICTKKMREQLKKEKSIYANMFEKFAKMDTQVFKYKFLTIVHINEQNIKIANSSSK